MNEIEKRNQADIQHLVKELNNHNAVLFVGAGMSMNAVPVHEHVLRSFQSWNGFMVQLAQKLWPGLDKSQLLARISGNYLYITQLFKERFGDTQFYQEFLQAVPTQDYIPSKLHYSLLSLPWMEIVTTNQDDLIEKGLDELKIPFQKIISDIDVTISTKKRLMKLHGSWERPESLVFAEEDYRTYEKTHPLLALRMKQLFAEKTIFFIGYSLQDEDFKRLFGWVRDILGPYQKKAYAYIPNADIYEIQYWEKRHLHLITDTFQGIDFEETKLLIQHQLQKQITELHTQLELEKAKNNQGFKLKTNYKKIKHLAIYPTEKEFIKKWLRTKEENMRK